MKYDIDKPIDVYTNYNIKDGIHRLAICLYFKIKQVSIKINNADPCLNYPNEDYYRQMFNRKQLKLLLAAEQGILNV